MPRETAAQKKTRISLMLGELDAKQRELRKLAKEVDDLKEKAKEIESGTYGDWVLGRSAPREILDQKAAKDALTSAGIPIPTKMTDAPVTINPVAAK